MSHAEEYELGSQDGSQSEAGPSRANHVRARPSLSKHRSSSYSQPGKSTTSVLFNASSSPLQSPLTTPKRLHRAHFLEEEGIAIPNIGAFLGVPEEDEDHFAMAQGMKPWRGKLFLLMEEPRSGREAFYIHIGITGAILFSAILTTFSTLPTFHTDPSNAKALFALDVFLVVLFTVEYGARLCAHSESWRQLGKWMFSFLPIIDLLAVLPFYLELLLRKDTSNQFRWSILRVFRLLRVFSSFTHESQLLFTIEVMYLAIQRSKEALAALLFFTFVIVLFFSTLMYFAERGTWDATLGQFLDGTGDPSQFDSIPSTAWFVLVTIATVGYGDMVPTTALGKLISVPLLSFGLVLIAAPSFVLSREFAAAHASMSSMMARGTAPSTTRSSMEANIALGPTTGQPLLPETPRAQPPLPGISTTESGQDLSNTKLAKNQMVLLEQIESMRRAVDKQSSVITELLREMHDIRARDGANTGS